MSKKRKNRGISDKKGVTLDVANSATGDGVVNDNGYLTVDAYLTRSGLFNYLASEIKPEWPNNAAVQSYSDDAVLVAYRPPNEVISDAYVGSARHVPITNDHPPAMLSPDNVRSHPVGTSTGNVRAHGGKPRATLVLWDARAINAYRKGKRDISVGAYNQFVWTPGSRTPDGKPYDFEVRDSRVNHIAIVDRGRAGPDARILDEAPPVAPVKKRNTMKVTIGNAVFDLEDNAVNLLEAERAESKATIDRLTGERDAAANHKLSDSQIQKLVDSEIAKRDEAEKVSAMRAKVLDAGLEIPEDASDDYVRGAYKGLEVHEETGDGGADQGLRDTGVKIGKKTKDDSPVDIMALKRRLYK